MKPQPIHSLFLAALLAAAGCVAGQEPNKPNVPAVMAELQDIEHRLTSAVINGTQLPVPQTPRLTIKFHSDGKLSGDAGVNRYFGGIELTLDGAFRWEPPGFATTRMAGEPKLMELEAQFLKGLRSTRVLRPLDAELVMASSDGQTTFKFARMTVAKMFSGIQDRELRLVRLIVDGKELALPERARITFRLEQGTQFSGQSVINGYSGSIHTEPDGRVQFSARVEATLMAGAPESTELENAYFRALLSAQRVRLTSGGMILEKEDKTAVLEFSGQ